MATKRTIPQSQAKEKTLDRLALKVSRKQVTGGSVVALKTELKRVNDA